MRVHTILLMLTSMLLTTNLAAPEPSANLSPDKATTTSSKKHTTTTKKKITTSSKESIITTSTTTTATPTPTYLCNYDSPKGLLLPKPGAKYYWDEENGVTFEIFYCSAEYFKTSSNSGDVWFNNYGNIYSNGVILALRQTPDDKDSDGGFSSYRFNVTLFPENGEAQIGPAVVGFYEIINGYYVSYNYQTYTVNITIERKPSSSSSAPPPTYPMATGLGSG